MLAKVGGSNEMALLQIRPSLREGTEIVEIDGPADCRLE